MSEFGMNYGHNINDLLKDLKNKDIEWDKDLKSDQLEYLKSIGVDYKNKLHNYADSLTELNSVKIDIEKISEIVTKVISNLE